MRIQDLLFLLLVGILQKVQLCSSASSDNNNNKNAALTSPVKHWDASWAASCASGTAICQRFDDGVLVVVRSPATNVYRLPLTTTSSKTTKNVEFSGLQLFPVDNTRVQFAPSWLTFENSLCVLTGLASDVEHLARIVQNQVEQHQSVYQSPLTTHGITQRLSRVLQSVTFSGGRPFGVQVLLVGVDDITSMLTDQSESMNNDNNNNESTQQKNNPGVVYTIDPSGSWQSWGSGRTAIGKHAPLVRQELAKQLDKNDDEDDEETPQDLRHALEQVISSWVEACRSQNINLKSGEEYQAFVIRKKEPASRGCQVYVVSDEQLQTVVGKVLNNNVEV